MKPGEDWTEGADAEEVEHSMQALAYLFIALVAVLCAATIAWGLAS